MVWVGVLVTLVAVACARLAYGTLLPGMRASLGLSYLQAGRLGTLTSLGYLLLLLPAGLLARRWSSRGCVLLGLGLITLGFAGLWQVQALLPLQLLMTGLGVGTAFVFTPLISLLAGWFPQRRGAVIGLATGGIGVGLLLTGLITPWLARQYGPDGWRLVWAGFGGLGTVTLLLVWAVLRDPPAAHTVQGAAPPAGRSGPAVYRQRGVLRVGLAYGLLGFAYSVQTIFMPSYTLGSGLGAAHTGALVALSGLFSVFSGVAWGGLSDRLGRTPALLLASALIFLTVLGPVLWPVPAVFVLHWALLGLTISGLFTLLQAAGTDQVTPADAPLALSTVTLFFAVGQLLGPALAGALIEHTPGGDGFRLTFSLVSLAALTALGLCFRIHQRRPAPA
jgi:MFS family permease